MFELANHRRLLRLLVTLAFIMLQAACSTSPVIFSAQDREDAARHTIPADDIVVFVDRHGSLYPGPEVEVSAQAMTNFREHSTDFASLKAMYRGGVASKGWAQMRAEAGVPDSGTFDEQWNQVQGKLRANLVAKILERTQGIRPLVILIHGFNNDYAGAESWYRLVSEDVQRLQRDAIVLRLHWDGMVQDGVPVFIWREAQWNAAIVGLALRDLLHSLPVSQPVRVLTHSTGAVVAANALGDGTKALQCDQPGFSEYCEAISRVDTLPKLERYRVALVIPAASLDTFKNYQVVKNANWPERVILGLNRDDFPTNKAIFSCRWDGATCMNTWAVDACREVKAAFATPPSQTKVSLFQFSNSPGKSEGSQLIFWEDHAMTAQRKRNRWWPLLSQLLEDSPTVRDDSEQTCASD